MTPIVLLHGVGLDHTMWQPLQRVLDRQSLALDLPGHGEQPPLTEPQSLESLANDVLNRLPEGRVHLVGFSLGALIGQYLARFHPDRIASLVSVSSVCKRTPEEAMAVAGRLATARSEFADSVTASLQRWYPEGTTVPADIIAQTEQVLLANNVDSYLFAYEVFAHGDAAIAPELSSIAVPMLAITGELDPGSTPDMSQRLAESVPGAELIVVPGARHMLPVEDVPALAGAINEFIHTVENSDHD